MTPQPPAVERARALGTRLLAAVEGPERIPIAWTLRGYPPAQLSRDILAGLTVAALIVPLAIGYAGVAGLPPQVGLYASIAPMIAYALLGSGRRLIVGPDAASAALIAATIVPLAAAPEHRVQLAGALALIVAAIFLGMRLARMGFLADFLSRPILVGYMAGVGVNVALSQLPKILGAPILEDSLRLVTRIDLWTASPSAVVDAVGAAIRASGANLASLAIGVTVLVAMLVGKRLAPRVPMALIAMVAALALSAALDLQAKGVRVLGPVPAGLPPLGIPFVSVTELLALLPGAVGIAILTFADTSATGRSFAARAGERTDSNRELIALAGADAAGALSGGYPISSSASRTSAAEGAGAATQLTGIVAAAGICVVLVLLTGPLAYLPTPALAAVILASVIGLIDIPQLRRLLQLKVSEGAIALIAMGGVILYGTLPGVAVAVLLAALNVVRRAAAPPIVEEVRLPDGRWADSTRSDAGRRIRGVVVLRIAAPLFFANSSAVGARIRELVAERPDVHAVVLDLGASPSIDITAADALRQIDHDLRREGRGFAVARVLGTVRDELRANGLEALLEPAGGHRGSIDQAIVGLGLDPETVDPAAPGGRPAAGGQQPHDGQAPPDAHGAPGVAPASRDHWHAAMDAVVGPAPGGGGGRPVVRLVLVGLVAIVLVATAASLIFRNMAPPAAEGTAQVPNLVGMTLDQAGVAASDAGLRLASPIYVRRDDAPEDTVVAQDPPPGTVMDAGSIVQPIVSTGTDLIVVPDVLGMPEPDAIVALTSLGLRVSRDPPVQSATIPPGSIVTTDPPPGTTVITGTTVSYAVSAGSPSASPGSPSASSSTAPPSP